MCFKKKNKWLKVSNYVDRVAKYLKDFSYFCPLSKYCVLMFQSLLFLTILKII